jgi:hypothetical protein
MKVSHKSAWAIALKELEAKKGRLLKHIAIIDRDMAELERMAREHSIDITQKTEQNSPHEASEQKSKHQDEGTVGYLVHRYQNDKDSPFQKLKFRTKEHYASCLKRIDDDCGRYKLNAVKARDIDIFYQEWTKRGLAMAHSLITLFRITVNYGAVTLENNECVRLSVILRTMRFVYAKPRENAQLSEDQVRGIINQAHEKGLDSIALAQAFQFDCKLGQRDVIGEWLPLSEPGTSEIVDGQWKWLRGIRWSDIDENRILRHASSNTEFNLRNAPLVMAELSRRNTIPQKGPLITSEKSGLPYQSYKFRRLWRLLADAVDVPKNIKNMDSRAEKTRRMPVRNTEAIAT